MNKKINDRILEENRKLHNFSAHSFDNYPPYAIRTIANMFNRDIAYIKSTLLFSEQKKVLDCGGGTGILGGELAMANFDVDIVDISEAMINIAKDKISGIGNGKKQFFVSDIDSFFNKTKQKYDMICFTSVLHHIGDYKKTLLLAEKHLKKNGVLYIADEPQLMKDKNSKACKRLEYIEGWYINLYRAFKNPKHAINFLRSQGKKEIDVNMAEYHAGSGIDDTRIVMMLLRKGFRYINHKAYIVHTAKIFERFDYLYKDQPKAFKLVMLKC